MMRFHSLAGLVIGLALVVGCAGPSPQLWPAPPPSGDNYHAQVIPPYTGRGPTVAVAGDSITMLTEAVQGSRLKAAGFSESMTGNLGYTMATMRPWIDLYSETTPDVMVINLGTNDVGAQVAGNIDYSLDLFEQRVDYYRTRFTSSCLVFVTITTHRTAVEGDPAKGPTWNAIAESYHEYLRAGGRVADWDTASNGRPGYLPDEVHPSASGGAALSALIVEAAQSCMADAGSTTATGPTQRASS